jgi:hypothetical protein
MKNVYVIVGHAGTYDDHEQWIAGVYADPVSCSEQFKKLKQFLIDNQEAFKNEMLDHSSLTFIDPQLKSAPYNDHAAYYIKTYELQGNLDTPKNKGMLFLCPCHGLVNPKNIGYSFPASASCPECGAILTDINCQGLSELSEKDAVSKRPEYYKDNFPEIYAKYFDK